MVKRGEKEGGEHEWKEEGFAHRGTTLRRPHDLSVPNFVSIMPVES